MNFQGPWNDTCGNRGRSAGSKGVARSKKHETHAAGIIVKEAHSTSIVLSRRYVGSGIREYGC